MSATALKKTLSDPRAKYLADIRGLLADKSALKAKLSTVYSKLFLLSHNWVHAAVTIGSHKTEDSAKAALAKTLRLNVYRVGRWAAIGKFMGEFGLKEVHNSTAISEAYQVFGYMTSYARSVVIQKIKDKEDHKKIIAYINNNKAVKEAKSETFFDRLEAKGGLTKTRCRMEMMAALKFVNRWKGEDCRVVVYRGDEKLFEVK